LRTLEGFSTTDIAQAQGRSDADVKKDIAAARKFMRQKLIEPAAAA
jgi:DNA-directed RNA polymerase specialized sigma24 family protein